MSNKASRVGIGMKMSRNDILAGAKMRVMGHPWAEIGKAVGVSAGTARKSVVRWGDDELRRSGDHGGEIRCSCGWKSRELRLSCRECGGHVEFFPDR